MDTIGYRLADGTELSLRGLTWAKADDAATEALYVLEALDDGWRKLHDDTTKAKDIEKHAETVAKMRTAAKRAAVAFMEKYLNAQTGTQAIQEKIIPQLTDADVIAIQRTAREGIGFHQRYLESLWSLDPITTFENKLDALCKTDEGKAYLRTLLPGLQKLLQTEDASTSKPSATT